MGTAEPTGRDLVPGFARMLIDARQAAGWSGSELARRSGVSQNTVSAIEREVRAPSLRVASLLVRTLGLKVWLDDPASPIAQPASPAAAGDPPAPGKGKSRKKGER